MTPPRSSRSVNKTIAQALLERMRHELWPLECDGGGAPVRLSTVTRSQADLAITLSGMVTAAVSLYEQRCETLDPGAVVSTVLTGDGVPASMAPELLADVLRSLLEPDCVTLPLLLLRLDKSLWPVAASMAWSLMLGLMRRQMAMEAGSSGLYDALVFWVEEQ
jgi:hypothetical protein